MRFSFERRYFRVRVTEIQNNTTGNYYYFVSLRDNILTLYSVYECSELVIFVLNCEI